MATSGRPFLGINLYRDPAVALVRDGIVLACSEEERYVRCKHARDLYPRHALQYCLSSANVKMEEIAAVGIPWNLPAYSDGTIRSFYKDLRSRSPLDSATIAWQEATLRTYNEETYIHHHHQEWRRLFGDQVFPCIQSLPHHETHALQSYLQSPFDEAVCLTLDGSGDQHCTVVWHCLDGQLTVLKEITIPHSLGWFYAAITEYLGFEAYDGEYKVMGLAAYGHADDTLRTAMAKILPVAADGVGYELNTQYIHHGPHSYSGRFTDHLCALLGRPPRSAKDSFEAWHHQLAFEAQHALEQAVIRLARWAMAETGVRRLCIGGGVGQNVKLNSVLFCMDGVDDVFVHPLCADAGLAAGSALVACYKQTGARPEPLRTLSLGYEESPEDIEQLLVRTHVAYEKPDDICEAVADELALGRIVGWFQGRMEAGPRALGQRSILADPRDVANRDRVNQIIKYREIWRPFCPSVTAEDMNRYFDRFTDAPFMIIAFPANERMKREVPAVVHIDGTARVQAVHREVLPQYHALIKAFEKRTGVPALLNTSFNVKGEPIVCSASDALRTFWATGLQTLALGDYLVRKPRL